MGVVLRGPGVYIPPFKLSNADLVNLVDEDGRTVLDTNDEWISERTGITERRISLRKSVQEMATLAVRDLEESLGERITPQEVIFATNRHREGEFPCYAASVAAALELENVALHDTLAGCTGLVYAIRSAHHAIASGEKDSVLVVGSERLSDFTNYGDRRTCVLFGDGAGAYLLTREDREGIITNYVGGVPDTNKSLGIERSNGKKLVWLERALVAVDTEDQYLVMDGPAVFKFAVKAMKDAAIQAVARSPYDMRDVDVMIPHGANIRIVDTAHKKLKDEGFRGTMHTNLSRHGNTSTASIPLAAHEAIQKGIIKDGSLVLNVAFGAGLTSGANLYRAVV